ncbi:LemA family protein [Cellvibrio fontiphilus]|uniref:LemA family protein n=1 Tax=Cellvibrio fontiphilus TaxID=1815559 RepID=A0ABV7FCW3_9GAMM
MITTLIVLVVLALLVFYVIGIYNKLVTLKNRFENAFSQIAVQLKRRYDLIPNLVETAKAYITHERDTLEAVVKARNQALQGLQAASANPGSPVAIADLANAETLLGAAMSRLSVVMEAYPDLKASQNMLQVSEELTSTENKIAFARQAFNDAVTEFNTYKQTFPPVLLANAFGFSENASLLEFDDHTEIQAAPKVQF